MINEPDWRKSPFATHLFDLLNSSLAWNIQLDIDTSRQQEIHTDLVRSVAGQGRVGRPDVQEVCHGGRHGKEHRPPPQP